MVTLAAARILVLSESAEVLQAVGQAAQPVGALLFQVEGEADLALRVHDLQPAVVVVDADARGASQIEALALAIDNVRSGALRPQVLLVGGNDAAHRGSLVQALAVDAIVPRPVDALELAVEVRTLMRVRSTTAEAIRDRDLLNHLLELTTLTGDHEGSPVLDEGVGSDGSGGSHASAHGAVTADSAPARRRSSANGVAAPLERLVHRIGEWLEVPHVVISLGPPTSCRVGAAFHARGSAGSGRSLVDRRHHELVRRGQVELIDAATGVLTGEDPSTLPYVGVPLRAANGEVLGVLHAWGGQRLPNDGNLRLLRVAAGRIGTEIQLRDAHRRLEEMVETRTADLTALLERLRGVNNQLVEANRETIMRLARAAEYRDGDTGEHVDRMSSYCQALAHKLGMGADEIALIKLAAPMHDVGKIGIPDAILLKRGRLTPEEWDTMRQHPLIGARILSGSGSRLLQMAELIAATHHERWDGTGYPMGISGTEIPLVGRIVALADVFDALTSPRVYKDAWSIDESVAYIHELNGKHFDPKVVDAFDACLDELLEIRSGYLGIEAGSADVLAVPSTSEAQA